MSFWKCFPCMRFQNEEVITKFDYSNCALTDVPPDVSQYERTLEELYLSSNRIRTLSPQLFYCQGLRVLFVNDNELESLPNAIGSLRHLHQLNLSRNGLSTVPDNIKSCKNLTRLDLSLNNLQKLPDAITSLISLQELLLNETNLEFLPANFGRLINLKILELRSNNLITLPKSMSRLSSLIRIDIGANEFTELPEVICQLTQLRELWIDVNRIRHISPNISNLRELKHFEANNNLLLTLPSEISNWRNLEVLSVSTNDMESLPFSIGMLKALVTLQCENNQLRELPDSICHLENLEEMVISHNFIIRLPSTIGMLRKLRFFCADENILRSLPAEICSCLNLAVLSIRSNKITELPHNIGHLINLHVLNVVDNYITYLPVSVLSLTRLTALWISDNQSQPLVPLQYLNPSTKTYLTCFMLPQQTPSQENTKQLNESSDGGLNNSWFQEKGNFSDSFTLGGRTVLNSSQRISFADEKADGTYTVNDGSMTSQSNCFLNEQSGYDGAFLVQNDSVSSPSRRICFADEVKGPETLATRLMRSPTPYPKELRLMAKYVRSNHQNQLQQQQPSQIGNMNTTNRPPFMSISSDQIDSNTYLTTISPSAVALIDGVKEARVLFNPSGNSMLLQQAQNTLDYHVTDQNRSHGGNINEANDSLGNSSQSNANYLQQQRSQVYSVSSNPIGNGQANEIYSVQKQGSDQSLPVIVSGDQINPIGFDNQIVLTPAQQQQDHLKYYLNSLNQPASSMQVSNIDQSYPHSPLLYDQQLCDTLYESSALVRQTNASPSVLSSYSQQGSQQALHGVYNIQINKPPPYHIARAFTKKSREDLLKYDTIRSQIQHGNVNKTDEIDLNSLSQENIEENHEINKCKISSERECSTLHDVKLSPHGDDSLLRGLNENNCDFADQQNNNSNLNRTYTLDCENSLQTSRSMLSLQDEENGILEGDQDNEHRRSASRLSQNQHWNGSINGDETIRSLSDKNQENRINSNSKLWCASPRTTSTRTWLFGLHKNPTVKQVAIKRDLDIGFEIQERPNQGIFVRATHPNTSAATLLHANDKLLEVDGYDFTSICLGDARQILEKSGPVINVMISRT